MRISLKNHQEVAHVWAQQNQSEGRASRMFFDGKSIFSYGRHFEIARFITDDVVFFNRRRYSSSTAKHQSYTRRAVSHKTVFEVDSFEDHKANVDYFLKTIENLLLQTVRGNAKNVEWRINEVKGEIISARDYVLTFNKSKKLFTKDQLKAIEDYYARRDNLLSAEQKAKLKEKIQAIKAADKKKAAAAEVLRLQRLAERQQALNEWAEGSITNHSFHDMPVRLRIMNDEIQTSKGAQVPLIEARKLWHMLQDRKDVSGMRVGHYTVTSCDAVNLTVGCHVIPLKEVFRMAVKLGWMNEVPA